MSYDRSDPALAYTLPFQLTKKIHRTVPDNLHPETPDLNALIEPVGWSLVLNGEDGKCAWRVQANRVAEATFGRYHVEWPIGPSVGVVDGPKEQGYGLGEKFVEALRPGDRVGLLMRAQFPGWENLLRYASVKLVYDVR